MASPCPSLDELLRLDSEAIDDPTFATLEAHLDSCERCQALLEEQLARAFPFKPIRGGPSPDGSGPSPPPLPGFVIERELGRGGFGVVYLASRTDDGRQVALKYLGGGPDDRARWRREAETMRKLDLPGVVQLLNAQEIGGWICLVMEYVAGGNLEQRLEPAPAPETAARVAEQIARTIAKVHETGLMHLDLKPSNILLGGGREQPLDDASLLVADFGLALPWGDPEATWTMAAGPRGTPSYMAPEQLVPDRRTIDPAADLYAIGAILYRMLTGRPPFLAPTKPETYQLLRDRDPVSVRRLNPRVPEALETICLACLRKNPAKRYPSADALADDLRRFLDGSPIVARPTPLPVLALRWCRRNRAVAGSILAPTLLVIALVVGQSARLRASRIEQERSEREVSRLEENLELFAEVFICYQDVASTILFNRNSYEAEDLLERLLPLRDRLQAAQESGTIEPTNLVAFGQLNLMIVELLLRENPEKLVYDPIIDAALQAMREAVRHAPNSVSVRQSLIEAELMKFLTDIYLIDIERAEEGAREALATVRSLPPEVFMRPTFRGLVDMTFSMATRYYALGDLEASLRWLDEARRLVIDIERAGPPGEWIEDPKIVRYLATIAMAHSDMDEARSLLSGTSRTMGALTSSPTLEGIGIRWFILRLGSIDGLPPLTQISDPRMAGPPGELADLILDDSVLLGLGPREMCQAVQKAVGYFVYTQRQEGNFDHARRTAGRIVDLCHELIARIPEEPGARLLLSEAYMQFVKIGQDVDNPREVRRGLTLAIGAIEEALALDPDNEKYRASLAERTRSLNELPDA